MKNTYILTEPELDSFAQVFVKELHGGDVVLLSGELGAGKTTLTKAIARALDSRHTVTSPTFTLLNLYTIEHPSIKQLAHIDTYRFERPEECEEAGLTEFIGKPDTLTIIEWPEKIEKYLHRGKYIQLHLSGTGTTREIRCSRSHE